MSSPTRGRYTEGQMWTSAAHKNIKTIRHGLSKGTSSQFERDFRVIPSLRLGLPRNDRLHAIRKSFLRSF